MIVIARSESSEAIQLFLAASDCFAEPAMTAKLIVSHFITP